jgi:predicted NUDIX family NTP pyrophosphohydrolase
LIASRRGVIAAPFYSAGGCARRASGFLSALIMPKQSAGLLLFRRNGGALDVFLVHPGGPFWKNKDAGSWTIPKGEFASGEPPLDAARRELTEETGLRVEGPFLPLGSVKQAGGKVVHAWAVEADVDAGAIKSNTFQIEWPPRSGRMAEFPEIDRAAWFSHESAAEKISAAQREFIVRLQSAVGRG